MRELKLTDGDARAAHTGRTLPRVRELKLDELELEADGTLSHPSQGA